jgi:imidazolonepropionase
MKAADLIIHGAGQLVTCDSKKPKRGPEMLDPGIIADGAIAVANGRIAAVGKASDILAQYSSEDTVDAGGRVVSPGFVDPHTHIVFAGDRINEFELKIRGADYLEILEAGGGILSTVRSTRAASEGDLIDSALSRLDKMVECGTTTAEVKTGYGLETAAELKMLRVIETIDEIHDVCIVPTFLAAHTVPPEFKDDAVGYADLICTEMLPKAWSWYTSSRFASEGMPLFADVFCERNAFDAGLSRRILETAAQLGFGVKAHVDQFTNLGGSRLAIDLNAASIDHLDAISDEEIALLAASKTVGVVIPTENFSAGKTKFAPARKLVDSGCAVAISTDFNPGSAPCPSQQMAMAIACRYQKLMPAEAFNAATINAAYAIGCGSEAGSLSVGKRADILILGASDYREAAYEFGGNLVESIIVGGEVLL